MNSHHGRGAGGNSFFPNVRAFMNSYTESSSGDQRAAQTFMDCEATEAIKSLRNELLAISSGNYNADSLNQIVGKGRLERHGSYDGWAKAVLQWMAAYQRGG